MVTRIACAALLASVPAWAEPNWSNCLLTLGNLSMSTSSATSLAENLRNTQRQLLNAEHALDLCQSSGGRCAMERVELSLNVDSYNLAVRQFQEELFTLQSFASDTPIDCE